MAEVILPRHLADLFPGTSRRLETDAATVREVVAALDRRAPGMGDRLLMAGPALREHLRVFVDGTAADLDTPVAARSVVQVIMAVSGG